MRAQKCEEQTYHRSDGKRTSASQLVTLLMSPFRLPRNAHLWVPGYVRSVIESRKRLTRGSTTHVIFTVADHFEPGRGRPGLDVERERIRMWTERYPELAVRFMDADGYHPQHTFFYPEEE